MFGSTRSFCLIAVFRWPSVFIGTIFTTQVASASIALHEIIEPQEIRTHRMLPLFPGERSLPSSPLFLALFNHLSLQPDHPPVSAGRLS